MVQVVVWDARREEPRVTEAERILEAADSVLVVDWPSRDVPDTLVRAGFTVLVKAGSEPDDYVAQELEGGQIVPRRVGGPPEHVDLVYSYRPIGELAGLAAMARTMGAVALWRQSGLASDGVKDPTGCWVPEEESRQARGIVESAGLTYLEQPYIADAVRQLGMYK
jgi:predicted CoA-binding protein